jgi:hypothetical protein
MNQSEAQWKFGPVIEHADVEVFHRRSDRPNKGEPPVPVGGEHMYLSWFVGASVRLDLPGGLLIWKHQPGTPVEEGGWGFSSDPAPCLIPWHRIEQVFLTLHERSEQEEG